MDNQTPNTDKWLHADGSVTTLAGEIILPADAARAEEYASRKPNVAKWLYPDGSIVEQLLVSGLGSAETSDTAPDVANGKLGDFCVTPDGIFVKKMVQAGGGLILSGAGDSFNGFWEDKGVNDVVSSAGGDPQGTHYYQHESGDYFLCWNTAYSGYWWICTNLSYDNGSATAYRSTSEHTEVPPDNNWSGGLSGTVTWTAVASTSEPEPAWVLCFPFRTKDDKPFHKSSRLMKYSEGVTKVQSSSGFSMSLYPDTVTGGATLSAYLTLGSGGNMARFDSNSYLYVGESTFGSYNPTGATQALPFATYRNFRVNLSAAAITLSFSGTLPAGNYPYVVKLWLVPKSTVSGNPKHTVTWPASIKWVNSVNNHRHIGATGQADTPVLCELTTFDAGTNWIGRVFNILDPDKEASDV